MTPNANELVLATVGYVQLPPIATDSKPYAIAPELALLVVTAPPLYVTALLVDAGVQGVMLLPIAILLSPEDVPPPSEV